MEPFELFAQSANMPPGSGLYPWIVGALVSAVGTLVAYIVNLQKGHKEEVDKLRLDHSHKVEELLSKREGDHKKMMRIALRTQRILSALANVPGNDSAPDAIEELLGDDRRGSEL